jgi:hypothetical protein
MAAHPQICGHTERAAQEAALDGTQAEEDGETAEDNPSNSGLRTI